MSSGKVSEDNDYLSYSSQNTISSQRFHLEQVGHDDVLSLCPMENVIIEHRLVDMAVRVRRISIWCLLRGQPVLKVDGWRNMRGPHWDVFFFFTSILWKNSSIELVIMFFTSWYVVSFAFTCINLFLIATLFRYQHTINNKNMASKLPWSIYDSNNQYGSAVNFTLGSTLKSPPRSTKSASDLFTNFTNSLICRWRYLRVESKIVGPWLDLKYWE